MYQSGFFYGKVRPNLPLLKRDEIVFLLAAAKADPGFFLEWVHSSLALLKHQ